MSTLASSKPTIPGTSIMSTIVVAGLAGAAIDAVYFSTRALIKSHSPVEVLQSIAAFWFGSGSFDLGATSAIVGGATHVGLATVMAAGFVLLARRAEFFRSSPLPSGVAYGLMLYVIMYLIVMPLRWPTLYPRWDGWSSVLDIGVHLIIGVGFALIARAMLDRDHR